MPGNATSPRPMRVSPAFPGRGCPILAILPSHIKTDAVTSPVGVQTLHPSNSRVDSLGPFRVLLGGFFRSGKVPRTVWAHEDPISLDKVLRPSLTLVTVSFDVGTMFSWTF